MENSMQTEAATATTTVPPARLKRVVTNWFDFQLRTHDKAALLQAFPRVAKELLQQNTRLALPEPLPKGKEQTVEALVAMFIQTLSDTEQVRLRHDTALPKHYLHFELEEFLQSVILACARSGHRSSFSGR